MAAVGRCGAAAAIIFAALTPAYADVRSESQLRQFVEMLDSGEDWTARADLIRSEGDDTIAEGLVVSSGSPEFEVRVEELRLSDLEEHSEGGGFSASAIEASGIALASEFVDYDIPAATVLDVAMPSVAGIEFDPEQLMTTVSAYYSVAARGELGEFTIPEMTAITRQVVPGEAEPGETRFTYRNYRIADFRDGVIGTAEIGPLTGTVTAPGQDPVEIGIEKMTATSTDFGAIARILDEKQYEGGRGDEIWRPVLASGSYSGLSVSGPGGISFRLAEVAIENMEGRQPATPFTGDFDRLLDPSVPEDAKAEFALEMISNLYSAWRVGTVRMGNFALEAPAENLTGSLGGITISGLSSEGIESFALEALEGSGPGGFASLGSFEFAGLAFPDLQALMQFAALESDAAAAEHEETLRAAFAAMPRIAHIGFSDVAGGLSEAMAVRLGSFTLDLTEWNDIWAESTQLRFEGLEVPRALVELNAQASQMMEQLGYDRLVLGMSIEDRWSPDSGSDDATWTLSMQDAGEVALSYSLTGVTIDWLMRATAAAARAADPNAAYMQMLSALGLESATLKVTDRSLLDRGFTVAAKMQGLSVEGPAYREQMRGALPFLLSAAVPAELSKLLSKPLQQFLSGGQTLVAEIAPPAPIPIPELMQAAEGDPLTLPTRLGIEVRTEAAAE